MALTENRESAPDGTVRSLAKMLQILECFSAQEGSLTPSEISAKTGIPRTTVHRIVATMRNLDLLDQTKERERYRLGLKLFNLGSRVLQNMDVYQQSVPYKASLARVIDARIELAVFDGDRAVIINSMQPMSLRPGASVLPPITLFSGPSYCTAAGKAILAFQPLPVIDRIIAQGLIPFTPRTIVDKDELYEELSRVRERGYAICEMECYIDERAIAAPVRNVSGRVIAAITVFGPLDRITESVIRDLAPILVDHTNRLSTQLGYISKDALHHECRSEPC